MFHKERVHFVDSGLKDIRVSVKKGLKYRFWDYDGKSHFNVFSICLHYTYVPEVTKSK